MNKEWLVSKAFVGNEKNKNTADVEFFFFFWNSIVTEMHWYMHASCLLSNPSSLTLKFSHDIYSALVSSFMAYDAKRTQLRYDHEQDIILLQPHKIVSIKFFHYFELPICKLHK